MALDGERAEGRHDGAGSVRASEQGPAEVDVVRWAVRDERWIAADSDPGCIIVYADAELTGWMPLPKKLPKLRANGDRRPRVRGRFRTRSEARESGIAAGRRSPEIEEDGVARPELAVAPEPAFSTCEAV